MIEKSKCEPLGLCLLFLFLCDIIEIEPEGTGINRNLGVQVMKNKTQISYWRDVDILLCFFMLWYVESSVLIKFFIY